MPVDVDTTHSSLEIRNSVLSKYALRPQRFFVSEPTSLDCEFSEVHSVTGQLHDDRSVEDIFSSCECVNLLFTRSCGNHES